MRIERVALVVALAGVLATGACKMRMPGSRAADAREARQTAALAWVNALGASEGGDELMRRLTAGALMFRSTGEDRRCEGRVAVDATFTAWLACVRAKPDLREFSGEMKLFHDALATDPARHASLKQYLPRIVSGDEAWSRYVGADEQGRSSEAFRALKKEAGKGKDGEWTTVVASWLYTNMTVRVQVVGPAADPRVTAALIDVHRFAD